MGILHELSEVIGTESAVKLGQNMGGARIYVPAKATDEHPLTIALGKDKAQHLCNYYGGDTIELPSKRLFREARDRVIRRDYQHLCLERGCKADHLAIRYGLSRRQILNIVNGTT